MFARDFRMLLELIIIILSATLSVYNSILLFITFVFICTFLYEVELYYNNINKKIINIIKLTTKVITKQGKC